MANMLVWHRLYVNPAPVHQGVKQFQSHTALPCYPLEGDSSIILLWFLIWASLFPLMGGEQMPSLHFQPRHTATLAYIASENTTANSCCPSSKTVLTSETGFPICGSVVHYFLSAENLSWKGRTCMQRSEEQTPLWGGFFLQFGAVGELRRHLR